MSQELFKDIDRRVDPLWIVKSYFNSISGFSFPIAADCLLGGTSFGNEYYTCDFPCEEEDDIFEGVRFRILDDEVIVSEEIFKEYLQIASKRYFELNPEISDEVQNVLKKLAHMGK